MRGEQEGKGALPPGPKLEASREGVLRTTPPDLHLMVLTKIGF